MNSIYQGVTNFSPFKKFEYILKSKLEPFPKKIQSLIEIWKSLGQCNQQNSEIACIVQIMDWAKLHTLNIVLTAKWKMFKDDFEATLLSEVEKTQSELTKISDVFSKKFQKLADVIRNPWDDPVLANLLHDNNAAIGQPEIEFFCVETAYLVSVRLKKLCESQCEDLALNLVTAFMNCYNLSQTENFSLNATKTQVLFCFDIHVALLYRYSRMSEIVALFKNLSLDDGLQLIRRFAKKRVKISKVWRNYPEITFLASQVFVTAAVTKTVEDDGSTLRDLMEAWIGFAIEHEMLEKLENSIRRIIQAATAAQHIYVCCEIIHEKFGMKLKPFTIELYIRALTTDMNNLENQKSENEKEKFDETTKRLATGFFNLADILKDNIEVSRECALTAFSLEPTLKRLHKIEDLARLSGFNVLDTGQIWECKLHPPIQTTDDVSWICNACGKWMCKPSLDLRLTTNFALNEALNFETLGISSQLCDDLAVVLNGPRYQLLTWLLRWEDLHRLCEMYLNDMERTKNLVTELKFVDIDYSMFASVKREPVDEMAGIERGYEKFLYPEEKMAETEPEPAEIPLPHVKSDPNTLKTLRMFRHNIKRSKPPQTPATLSNTAAETSGTSEWLTRHVKSETQRPSASNQQRFPEYFHSEGFSNGRHPFSLNPTGGSPPGLSLETIKSEARDYRSNLNKRKPTEEPERDGSKNHLLHQMISYEFMNSVKKSKPNAASRTADAKDKSWKPPHNLKVRELLSLQPPRKPPVKSEKITPHTQNLLLNKLLANRGESVAAPPPQASLKGDPTNRTRPIILNHRMSERRESLLSGPRGIGEGGANGQNHFFSKGGSATGDSKSQIGAAEAARSGEGFKHDKIIRVHLDRNEFIEKECSVQNENSSKHANCCPPTNEESTANLKIECKQFPGSYCKTSNAPNSQPTIPKQASVDHSCKLKTISELHKPTIVEEQSAIKPKAAENSGTRARELRIILHRLSNEVIKSFIPDFTGESDRATHNCKCGCGVNKKPSLGRPRKICLCCQYRSKVRSRSASPPDANFEKYPLRTLRKDSDNSKNIPARSTARRDSDIETKTAPRKLRKYHNKHKSNQKDDSDRMKKPKRDSCDKDKNKKIPRKGDISKHLLETAMNPRVVLERLPLHSDYVRSVLSNVPGLNNYEMIRPTNVNHIVNVVQISGSRSTTSVPVQNTPTSTQITPHIQRIGQPRSDKPEQNANSISETPATSAATPASTSNAIKPSTSQPSTLINILSQQIIRPGQSNCVRNRASPLINILSQQIIRPATNQISKLAAAAAASDAPKTPATLEATPDATPKIIATTTKPTPTTAPGTILQFICKSTLPKFQQAFGKTVYQTTSETSDTTSSTDTTVTTSADSTKKNPPKNPAVNIQPIQGGVIYTRQMPVGQTINLIPPGGRGQVFRIATSNSDQISLVKDTVIHSKMSALLAAALQGKQKATAEQQSDGETSTEETRVTVTRPTLVQNARIVKPVIQIPSNVVRTSPQAPLSSTTLEQLREFDMVYKQIKERSSTSTPSEANTSEPNETSPQRISVTYMNQQGQKYTQLSPVVVVSSYCNLQPAASPALSVTSQGSSSPCVTPAPTPAVPKVAAKGSKGKTVKNTTIAASKSSPIPKPQQKPQEDEHTTQRIFDILAEYAEQLRNSPDLNNKPAPRRRSNPPTNPSQNSKRKKGSGSKKSGQCSSMVSEADMEDHTVGSEDSSCGVVQISVQEEEQQHVQTTTAESNDSSSAGSRQQLILADPGGNSQTRNLIIADSSVGEALKMPNTAVLVPGNYIMPVSMVKGGQQIAVVSGGSKILATVPARSGPNMLLFQSFLNQNRGKGGVPTVKYSTIQPISGISSQSIAGMSGQPPVILPQNAHALTAVTLGQPITLKKIDDADRGNTELLLTISQPRDNGVQVEASAQPDSTNGGVVELEEVGPAEKVFHTYQKAQKGAQAPGKEGGVGEQNNVLSIVQENSKSEPAKNMERVQSVLVTACTSNGPMLSHTPPRYRKASETGASNDILSKGEFIHNGEKQNNNEQKHFPGGNATYFHSKTKKSNAPRLDRELHQLCLQRKQAALERELRLQKSLSEECEDLGVDEPSTSDLFPEADILFDSNHSPSFDQSSQDVVKRAPGADKDENKSTMTLFSDDDNSSSMRTNFLFEPVEYHQHQSAEYAPSQQLTNGQSSNESSCEDHATMQNCASMSDVTLNSPVSPDPYTNDNTPPSLNKYKFKYSNRRKGERHKAAEAWAGEVSSSEDTTGSTELKSSSHSPESCTNKRSHSTHSISCDDELSDGSYKVVRVAISKSDMLKDDESCEELHCEDDLDCSPSGRGARRSVKKMCSCCNGSQDGGASKKRPGSSPHTPAPHKKAFLNKKR